MESISPNELALELLNHCLRGPGWPEELAAALAENGFVLEDMKGGKITKSPLSTLWDLQQQKQGRITFAELGRRLQLKLDPDLSLNYLGYARKSA